MEKDMIIALTSFLAALVLIILILATRDVEISQHKHDLAIHRMLAECGGKK